MAVLAAVNFEDGIVLLEDGRELPITRYYANLTRPGEGPLKACDRLTSEDRVDEWECADVFVVDIPGTDVALIVEIAAINMLKPSQIN